MLTVAGGIIIAFIVLSVLGAFIQEDPEGCFGCLRTVVLIALMLIGLAIAAALLDKWGL